MKQETIDVLREASHAAEQLQNQGVYHTSLHLPLLEMWRCVRVLLAEHDADAARAAEQPLTGEQMGGSDE